MFIPKKNKQRPMKIQTSVATPETNPVSKMLNTLSQVAGSVKKAISEAVKPSPGRY